MSKAPWRNWYHCMGSTYGAWLLGDGRGFRTRHHRQHVEGDYRFPPPPGHYERLLKRSRGLMKGRPVVLTPVARRAVCEVFAGALEHYGAQVAVLSVSGMHFHGVVRFVPVGEEPYEYLERRKIKLTHARRTPTPSGRGLSAYEVDPAPRRVLGMARSYVTHEMKRRGVVQVQGGLWGKRPLCLPVSERGHQVAAVRYIAKHERQGAAVWLPQTNAHALPGVG